MARTFETENGKELKIVQIKNTALYGVQFTSGGELPKDLNQMFTSPKLAADAIERYLNSRTANTKKKAVN
jgi:hypothetical protein